MDGLILVHKPVNCTSHDVVNRVRRILRIRKVGHFGTLDPLATGLLLMAVGKATKMFPFFLGLPKTYRGKIRFGFSTDTYDSEGKQTSEVVPAPSEEETIRDAAEQFKGEITQVSPPYSAKKYKGKPLYALARQSKKLELKSSRVFIHSFKLNHYEPPFIDFEVKCSTGTYVRSLAHDLGQKLKCGAHIVQLIRTDVGDFNIKDSHTLEEIDQLFCQGYTDKFLLPLESLLPEFPRVVLNEDESLRVQNGCSIQEDSVITILHGDRIPSSKGMNKEDIFRMFSTDGRLLAFARREKERGSLHPFLVITPRKNGS